MSKNERLFLLDGTALAYRAYFAFIRNPLVNSKGKATSAVFGFTNSLIKILDEEKPDHIAAVFDPPGKTFRHERYPEYKATREKMPPDMREQMEDIKKVVKGFNIPYIIIEGYEADDVIGTLAKQAESEGIKTYIVAGDKDFAQLITPLIYMYTPKPSNQPAEIFDADAVKEKFGVMPDRIIDLLGLMGDSSDNVPGVPGVGPKTAVKLIQEIGPMETILENNDKITQKKIRENLQEYKEQALLSKELVTIKTDVPVGIDFHTLKSAEKKLEVLIPLFRELEFRGVLRKLESEVEESGDIEFDVEEFESYKNIKNDEHTYHVVKNWDDFDKLCNVLKTASVFSFDLETTGVDPLYAEIVGFSFALKSREAYYLPADFQAAQVELAEVSTNDLDKMLALLKPVLEDETIEKCGQNIKYDMLVLSRYGIEVQRIVFDTMIASYLLRPSEQRNKLDAIALDYLKYEMIPITQLIGERGKNQKSMRDVPLEDIAEYAAEDADIPMRLKDILDEELKKVGMDELFYKIEVPLIPVLEKMERNGVGLDVDMLKGMSKELNAELERYTKEIHDLAGDSFNVNSTQQLGKILFEKLEIHKELEMRPPRKTKTGNYSTASDVLALFSRHPLPQKVLEYRQLKKLQSTYIDALPKLIHQETGRVHTSFNQTHTATGRLSSSNPNLQNIPIRTEMGRKIRKAFVPAKKDTVILAADYSQIELRIMAHISRDEGLIAAFQNGEDIHQSTASAVFDIPMEEVSRDHRRKAKEVNFGILYGITSFGLANRLGIKPDEAQEIITEYFVKYPKVNEYIFTTLAKARRDKFVTTLFNRRRYIPEIENTNRNIRSFAERTALNAPIQGTAADMIKIAMIHIHHQLLKNAFNTTMILQVHDELVFEVPQNELDAVQPMIENEMKNALELSVPVVVDIGIGHNWYEAH